MMSVFVKIGLFLRKSLYYLRLALNNLFSNILDIEVLVNIYFDIAEGDIYTLASIKISDDNNILNSEILELINQTSEKFITNEYIYKNFQIEIS